MSLTFGFALFAHVGLEVAKPRLLKMYTVSQFALLLWDVIWLSLWARRIDRGAVGVRKSSATRRGIASNATRESAAPESREDEPSVASLTLALPPISYACDCLVLSKQDDIFANAHYHGTPRFLLGMQILLFLSRPVPMNH